MDVKKKLVDLILSTDLGLSYSRESDALNIADNLIAHGVTVQERVRQCWDVCNNNGNTQYRCPHCETVYVYMYKNHNAPDSCKECGARLYLPQPPKGE